jgi:DNA-binding LacI/PurR family transcriptional regulator
MTQTLKRTGYLKVQDSIRKRVLEGKWKVGSKIPSERELEKEFQISRLTISKGLSNLVTQGLLIRRRGQGTFVAESGVNLVPIQKRLVKFISPMPLREGVISRPGILEGMHEILVKKGYHTGVDFYHSISEHIELLKSDNDDYHAGFIVWHETDDGIYEELKRMKQAGYPFVMVDSFPADFETDFIATNHIEGSRLVVKYLVDAGHKAITYVTRRINRTSLEDRLAGFVSGMIACDLPIWENSTVKLKGAHEEACDEIGPTLKQLFSASQKPTALFFSHDDLAIEAVAQLRSMNIRVPEEVSIICNDNFDPNACEGLPLTTITQDFFEMGKVAAQVLLEKLENRTSVRPQQIYLKPILTERKSVMSLNK